ncbi:hypothetical protein V1281_002615 [Nitrobacteraceae bacterium AZCC 2161]
MLNTTTTASKSMAPPRSVRSGKRGEADTNPPVLTPSQKPDLHPVYGSLPIGRDGFTLDRQMIQMLNFWHHRAVDICLAFEKAPDDAGRHEFEEILTIKEDIYRASLKAEVKRPSEVALQLQIIVRDASLSTDDSCEFLSVKELSVIAMNLLEATKPLVPKKRVGALRRGRKLTVAGLHVRYQSFLIQELETLSVNLYGSRDYAKQFRIEDDAVNLRCQGRSKTRYPFFDESKLTTRARAVLKSLKIDTERDDDIPRLPKSKRVSYDRACKKVGAR